MAKALFAYDEKHEVGYFMLPTKDGEFHRSSRFRSKNIGEEIMMCWLDQHMLTVEEAQEACEGLIKSPLPVKIVAEPTRYVTADDLKAIVNDDRLLDKVIESFLKREPQTI